jgi:hypothetical protein
MKQTVLAAFAAGLVAFSAAGRAETRVFEGTIPSSRDVVRLPLTLSTDLTNAVLWTDSFQDGLHFDPILALWRDGVLLEQNDDHMLMPGQTVYDSSLLFGHLHAGTYLVTIASYANFANGELLSGGFRYDDPAIEPNPLYNCVPGGDCPGNYWRLNLSDGPIPQVPELATTALWMAGLGLLALRAGRGAIRRFAQPLAWRARCSG